jgi:hypothetical protein
LITADVGRAFVDNHGYELACGDVEGILDGRVAEAHGGQVVLAYVVRVVGAEVRRAEEMVIAAGLDDADGNALGE